MLKNNNNNNDARLAGHQSINITSFHVPETLKQCFIFLKNNRITFRAIKEKCYVSNTKLNRGYNNSKYW